MGRPFGTKQSAEVRRRIGIGSSRAWKRQRALGQINRGASRALKLFYDSPEGLRRKRTIAKKVRESWRGRDWKKRRMRMSLAKKGIVWSAEAIHARSLALKSCYASGRHPGGGPNGWHRQLYNGVVFSSSYEVALVKWLDKNRIAWQYQPKRFLLGDLGTYRPDFYLPKYDLWIEVKGAMMSVPMKKFFAFRKCYPNVWLLDKEVLHAAGILE